MVSNDVSSDELHRNVTMSISSVCEWIVLPLATGWWVRLAGISTYRSSQEFSLKPALCSCKTRSWVWMQMVCIIHLETNVSISISINDAWDLITICIILHVDKAPVQWWRFISKLHHESSQTDFHSHAIMRKTLNDFFSKL